VKLEMSVMRVSRSDPGERMFVRMLMRSQSEEIAGDVPVLFPVFGRGRILTALAGSAIVAGNLEDAATFLAGPCSCQVKELNPGIDILMAADWDSVVEGREAVVANVGRISIPEPKIAAGSATKPVNAVAATQAAGTAVVYSSVTIVASPLDKRLMLKIAISVTTVVMIVLGLVLLLRKNGEGR
jgi:O-succinylbenzoate synthase